MRSQSRTATPISEPDAEPSRADTQATQSALLLPSALLVLVLALVFVLILMLTQPCVSADARTMMTYCTLRHARYVGR